MRTWMHHPTSYFMTLVIALLGGLLTGSLVVVLVLVAALSIAWVAMRRSLNASRRGRIVWTMLAVATALAAAAQLVPYGRDHTNPPVTAEPAWNAPETRALAVRACFDCHGNETAWPWYTDVAPISWLLTNHVVEGRRVLNFSTWDRPQGELDEIAETIREGEMPPASYVILHPDARLSGAEKQQLIDGLEATITASPPG
ncbi:MAG: heme-binding domain-containing protein [Actinomycetota bacterium]